MFVIEMLPAEYGDCLWIEYGNSRERHRIVIDGGTAGTYAALKSRIEQIEGPRTIDLFVVTHIDSDHIDGALKLVVNPPQGLDIREFWFNAYKHTVPSGYLGVRQGEFLAAAIEELERRTKRPLWNTRFGGKAVVARDDDKFNALEFDGVQLTVLGPSPAALDRLRKEWERVMKEYDWDPGGTDAAREALKKDRRYRSGWLGAIDPEKLANAPFEEDDTPANGSSIVLMARYGRHQCLFAADCYPTPLAKALRRLSGGTIELSVCKVPHHGSMHNNSADLYEALVAEHYLFTTSGQRFGHPDDEAIARVVVKRPPRHRAKLLFNYSSGLRTAWRQQPLHRDWKFDVVEPSVDVPALRLELER